MKLASSSYTMLSILIMKSTNVAYKCSKIRHHYILQCTNGAHDQYNNMTYSFNTRTFFYLNGFKILNFLFSFRFNPQKSALRFLDLSVVAYIYIYIFVTIHKNLSKYEFSVLFEFFSFIKAKIKRPSAMFKCTFVRSEGQYTNSTHLSVHNKYTFFLMFTSISFSNIT